MKMLYLTKGLEAFKNKAAVMHGIEKAGLYRMLRNEYSHILTCHADIDPEGRWSRQPLLLNKKLNQT